MTLPEGAVVRDLVRAVGEHEDVVVAVRDRMPVAEDTPLVDGEQITLLSAASGG